MVRNVFAVILAFIVGGVFVFAVEAVGHIVYPIPSTLDTSDMEQLAEYVKTAPVGALAFVLAAQSAGSFMGGLTTGLVGKSNKTMLAVIYGFLALLMAALNIIFIPHPIWMIVASLVLPIPLSLVGGKLGQSLTGSESAQTTVAE